MEELIRRSDAIKAIEALAIHTDERYLNDLECGHNEGLAHAIDRIEDIPSADRPQGDVDAVAIFTREMHNLEQGYITIGEFDERIEPLRHLCYGRPRGEWLDTGKDPSHSHPLTAIWYCCSVCGDGTNTKTKFCPTCGSKMLVESSENHE